MKRICLTTVICSLAIGLAACSDSQPAASSAPKGETEVNVMALTARSIPITSELPGRTVAFNTAEIRPQVGGLIKSRDFVEGTNVKAGDILYQIDSASYDAAAQSAEATLERAQAAQRNAQTKTDRLKKLSDQQAISSQDFEDAELALGQAKADVASANAAIRTAAINVDRTKIRATVDGRIDRSNVNMGALVTADQTTVLTTIRQLDPIYVEVTQPSERILQFRKATSDGSLKPATTPVVHLTLEDGSIYPHTGKLQFSEASISETAGTVIVRAIFPNPDHLLLPGMYVRANIEEGVIENSYLVPQRAVTRNADGEAIAKVVATAGKVEQRTFKVERSVGSNWLVTGGVDQGDRLIVEGAQKAEVGQTVKAVDVVMNDKTGAIEPVAASKLDADKQPKIQLSER
jgi:membrane fusion protein (multidrug efflux system)